MSVEITMEEWLSELNRLSESVPAGDESAMTAEEIAQSIGRPAGFVRAKILGPGVRSGRVVCTKKNMSMINGVVRQVPAYRVVESEPNGKRSIRRR